MHSWDESGLAAVEPGPSAEPRWIPGPHGGSAPAPHPGRAAACADFRSVRGSPDTKRVSHPYTHGARLPCGGGLSRP